MPPGKKKRVLGVKSKASVEDSKPPAETSASVDSGAKKKFQAENLKSIKAQNKSHSEDSSSTAANNNSDPSASLAIRRPTYWLEMRGIKSSEDSRSGTEETPAKKKRLCNVKNKVCDDSDEDYTNTEQPQRSKPKARLVQKGPPSYPAGSKEAHWYLEIQDRGRITCPTCHGVKRKTVEGLKKHMATCKGLFKCPHCRKELKSAPGIRYHIMAEHSTLTVPPANGEDLDSQSERDRLRILLKRVGKIKCAKEGCLSNFTTIVGYLYHVKKCGKGEAELEQMALKCNWCGKAYQSRAGLVYHTKSEHDPVVYQNDNESYDIKVEEDSSEGRSRRRSAKVAIYHLHEIATEELIKEWPKRKVLKDLVPEETKLKFSRPGLPTFSQEVMRKWRTEMKTYKRLRCPNKGCDSVYGSISGLKAHLGCCTQGDFIGGKYKCLICEKEFGSESGVKYHINSAHSEEWFVVSNKSTKSFEKMMKTKPSDGKKLKKKKNATQDLKKKVAVKKSVTAKEPPLATLINGSEHRRNMPSETESEGKASSQSSLEDEGQSVVWRARQPIVKPASLTAFRTEEQQNVHNTQEAHSKPGRDQSRELPSALNLVLEKTKSLPGTGKTTTLKPGVIKAAVLKFDRRRK